MAHKTRVFKKQELLDRELPYECDGGSIISDRVVDNSRWSVTHEITFRFDDQPEGEAYQAHYDVGATEYQDERPWENEDTVTATVVRHVERVVKVWEPIEAPSVVAPQPAAS